MTKPRLCPWRKVVKAERILGPRGGKLWKLTLECGHAQKRRRWLDSCQEKRVRCWACDSLLCRDADTHERFPRKWETIYGGKTSGTRRLKVPTGWIVERYLRIDAEGRSKGKLETSLIFVPDPNHEWELEA